MSRELPYRVVDVRVAIVVEREDSGRLGGRVLVVQVVAHTVAQQLERPCDVCLPHARTERGSVDFGLRDAGHHPRVRRQVVDALPDQGRRRLHVEGCHSAGSAMHRDRLGDRLPGLQRGALCGRERVGRAKLELVQLAEVLVRPIGVVRAGPRQRQQRQRESEHF